MEYIKKILNKDSNLEELLMCFEAVRQNGDIAIIKFDGLRDKDFYTLMITFSNNERNMLRVDNSNLKEAMKNLLNQYIN